MMALTPFFFIYCKILSSLLCLEDPRQIVVVFAFCHEFTMHCLLYTSDAADDLA